MKERSEIVFYINQDRFSVGGEACFSTLSDFLRYEKGLTGTKVVCAEGDCGACTVLLASPFELEGGKLSFKSVNSCILPVLAVDGCQLVTVEGLQKGRELHPVQQSMLENFGSQCGYCTPGFVCAMAAMLEDSILRKIPITEKRAKNHLTGNLCRCTGYDPILKAATALDPNLIESLRDRYSTPKKVKELKSIVARPLVTVSTSIKAFLPTTVAQATQLKKKYPETRIVAGATDIGVAVNKGRTQYQHLMSLQNIPSLWNIKKTGNHLEIPARVSLSKLQKYTEKSFPEFDRMLNIFASPQIKNSGTLVGNVVNASPISDTIPFLLVSDAFVEVQSSKKKRLIPIDEFFLGYKKLDLRQDELVTSIHLPIPKGKQISKLYKVSLRKDLDISAVTLATRIKVSKGVIEEARIAFGGVGPVVIRLKEAEKLWVGQAFTPQLIEDLANKVKDSVSPISDVRGSKEYRLLLCRNLLRKFAHETASETTS